MFARRTLSAFPSTTSRTFSTSPRASLARMQLIGRLAAQPELTPTSTGRDIVRYAVGTTHRTSRGEETSWFRVASFVDEGARRDLILGLPKGYVWRHFFYCHGFGVTGVANEHEHGRA